MQLCPALCLFLVGFTAGQRIAQTGDVCFTKRPEVFGLKVRDQDKEQSDPVEFYQEGWLMLLEFAVSEPMPPARAVHHPLSGWRHEGVTGHCP